MPAAAQHKPFLAFMLLAFLRAVARLGQNGTLYPQVSPKAVAPGSPSAGSSSPPIGLQTRFLGRFGPFLQGFTNPAGRFQGRLGEVLESRLAGLAGCTQHLSGSLHAPCQHPHAIGQLTAIAGGMNVGFDDRSIRPQFAPLGHLVLNRQLGDALVELLQGLGLDELGSSDKCGGIKDGLKVHSTELTQDQAIAHLAFCLFVTEILQPSHNQHPLDDFDRSRVATSE